MYSTVVEFDACAGIEVTAAHNFIQYNGMKIVKDRSQPLTNREFININSLVEKNSFFQSQTVGVILEKTGCSLFLC